ncbi:mandelate racemase/muconate lactonizing enzyme family protein [Halorubrum sp. CBA1125]|uniref:mandelate racemase/muconate lactonizing enzyme family protein n=1 Tax=Halorubrum sp. CBA1125 TaxID=2668072 RepID=UPI0012E796DB|nr:mandelate racemase/muconate lactonizing enzyme family protein [Halorubrum sp. CBA1125]MUW14552.1 mandelate racemase/muconate lactonizing enzyme family protein [Halorubrum sp. CBA1125]
MAIADISAYVLSSPVDTPRSYRLNGGAGLITQRDVILVSVETTAGEIGWAPCGTGTVTKWEEFNEATHDDIGDVIRNIVGPDLVGEDIDDIASVHNVIDSTNLPEYLRWQAKSVVDIAVYDILGKRRGQPIYEFLEYDVDPTPTLTVYPSSGFYLSPEEYVEEATHLVEQGYDMYKYRAGFGVDWDRRIIDHLRARLDDEVDIIVDAHAWWSLDDASYSREEIRSLVEYMDDQVFWIEEPFPSNDYQSYRWLSEATGVPLAAGENEATPGNLVNMAELGFLSFLQGDVKQHGGYTGSRQAVEFCEGRDVTYVPHNYGTQLGVVANAHLVAAAPECTLLEYPIYGGEDSVGMYPFPLASDIIETELEVEDGRLTVPSGPGLGVSVDRSVIENYPYRSPSPGSVR